MSRVSVDPVAVALVAAKDSEGSVGPTVLALRRLPAIDEVLVVDDGSSDNTAQAAVKAGARVIKLPRKPFLTLIVLANGSLSGRPLLLEPAADGARDSPGYSDPGTSSSVATVAAATACGVHGIGTPSPFCHSGSWSA